MKKLETLAALETALKVRNYSPRTMKSYGFMCDRFLSYCVTAGPGKEPGGYANGFVMLLQRLGKGPGTINLYIAAIRFLFEHVIKKQMPVKEVPNLKKPLMLPRVFSKEEIKRILAVPKNEQHQLMLLMCYGCGLRVSELIHVKVGDLELDRGVLKIVHGKGEKERYVSIGAIPSGMLKAQITGKQIGDYLFQNQHVGGILSKRTAQKILADACEKAGISHKHNIHMLRHSFATHSLERGTDVRKIQKMLGHSRVTTTEIYCSVSTEHLADIKGPLADVI